MKEAMSVEPRAKELQKCTKQELLAICQGKDAEISEKAEALAKAETKAAQLREMMVG